MTPLPYTPTPSDCPSGTPAMYADPSKQHRPPVPVCTENTLRWAAERLALLPEREDDTATPDVPQVVPPPPPSLEPVSGDTPGSDRGRDPSPLTLIPPCGTKGPLVRPVLKVQVRKQLAAVRAEGKGEKPVRVVQKRRSARLRRKGMEREREEREVEVARTRMHEAAGLGALTEDSLSRVLAGVSSQKSAGEEEGEGFVLVPYEELETETDRARRKRPRAAAKVRRAQRKEAAEARLALWVARHPAACETAWQLKTLHNPDLKLVCHKNNLMVGGVKAQLVERLVGAYLFNSPGPCPECHQPQLQVLYDKEGVPTGIECHHNTVEGDKLVPCGYVAAGPVSEHLTHPLQDVDGLLEGAGVKTRVERWVEGKAEAVFGGGGE
ncbi:hypothetical protein KIPB_008728 [Kipferlia bialata]|uniref:Uncharacterized protein n=1 Tax=Kipferlia bialata TaxID=797122 RepID=A0A9K3GLQ1_9EUKA|nr:hypothetical protein KIPB_008728 [Kipferlia bialata]|eukprot:g8728.t1